ncbi:MAG: DegT/DnrJ/EryC1/StrS family aminotransferase [Candidatus Rokuibacteriota bacterium]|nr:MAG: DegT/DnrJ/EryC1/StrS family aminotransferase [Candidatus Rokubacteria bacterium]
MIPVSRPHFAADEEAAVVAALRSGWVTQGPRVAEFERAFAAALGQPEAIAVSSCTAGLHLVLHALGIGRGDEVVVPSLSFIATANAVAHTGATPVFADIELATYNLDPASAATAISRRTKAIVLVHQVGLPADVAAFRRLARKARVKLVEDAACAIGSQVDGRPVGRDAAVAVFSFHPRKLVTTGEGGMIVTRDRRLATRLRSLRHHGVSMSDFARHAAGRVVVEAYREVGYNYRMTDVQAAMGLVQLGRLEEFVARRREQGERYDRAFAKHPALAIPQVPANVRFNYQTYLLRLLRGARVSRDTLMQRLLEQEIATRRGVMAAHREPAYRRLKRRVPLPATDAADRTAIVLPLFHAMTPAEQDRVIEAVLALV